MKKSFKIFTLVFFSPIVFIIIASLVGVVLEAITFMMHGALYLLIGVSLTVSLCYVGEKIAKHYSIKIVKAPDEELRREDDVLLQSVTFSAAIVFFYVNFLVDDYVSKIILSFFIVIFAISFYGLRAWGKIKQSPKYRHWSMMLLALLLGAYFAAFIMTITQYSFNVDRTKPMFSVIFGIVVAMFLSLIALFEGVFSKRYGYKSP